MPYKTRADRVKYCKGYREQNKEALTAKRNTPEMREHRRTTKRTYKRKKAQEATAWEELVAPIKERNRYLKCRIEELRRLKKEPSGYKKDWAIIKNRSCIRLLFAEKTCNRKTAYREDDITPSEKRLFQAISLQTK